MNHFSLLATGGTIASVETDNGLAPALCAKNILDNIPMLKRQATWALQDVFSMDSSNIQPEEWRVLADKTRKALASTDGVLITHGTDTLAYTASALSFMLGKIEKPVILTGSQLSLVAPLTDGVQNMMQASVALQHAPGGVYVLFHHKLILGTRAVKVRTTSFEAFDSINAPLAGEMTAEGFKLNHELLSKIRYNAPTYMGNEIDGKVFLLKLIPGTSPKILDFVMEKGYKGVVIEAFGLGGLHYIRRNLVGKLKELSAQGILTIIVTQCLYEHADFGVYEVGHDVLSDHVFSGGNMTTESAVTKLMWVLGDVEKRRFALTKSLYGEM